jgi:hypothetical protein
MPGLPDFSKMSAEDFAAWRLNTDLPTQGLPVNDKYAAAANSWLSNEFDFELPSGALCRMQKMPLKELAKAGILDRVTRLPGLVDGVIAKAENAPPSNSPEMPDWQTIEAMDELLNIITPMVVVAPKVWPMPDPKADSPADREKVAGRIYPDSIDLADRIAIMERSMSGVKAMDNFRPESD